MDVDENLPEKFKDIPIEFRLLQKKYDQQNIFTSVSNDVRLENRLRSHQYKEEHKSDLVRDAMPQYMSKIDNNIDMFREIESIIDQDTNHGMQAQMMKRSLEGYSMENSKSAGNIKPLKNRQHKSHLKSSPHQGRAAKKLAASHSSPSIKPKKERALPSIKKRYGGNVLSSWRKGPIDMPKDRYFDLNDSTIYGGSTDARARQLRQQTKLLMNSFQTTNKRAAINEVCRKRRVDDFKVKGEDHIVGSFDEMVAAQQELDRTSKAAVNPGELLKEVWECVRYRRREMKRRSNGRVLELWACLGCPVSSKLSFKLHADQTVPQDLVISARNQDNNAPPSHTIMSHLETLADAMHAANVLVLTLQLWCERNYPDVYTSHDLTHPLIDVCRSGGYEKCVKRPRENMRPWLSRLCKELLRITEPQLQFWLKYSNKYLDKHFTSFVQDLKKDLFGFVAIVEEESMMRNEMGAEELPAPAPEPVPVGVSAGSPAPVDHNTCREGDTPAQQVSEPKGKERRKVIMKIYDPDESEDEDTAPVAMRDESVQYKNTNKLSKKSQRIYESLPHIISSVNINKVSKNLLKVPNKGLSKRLARRGQGDLEDDQDFYS